MYQEIMLALKNASRDNSTITVFTGAGDYYYSGNDLNNLINATGEIQELAIKCAMALRELVSGFIDFPKPLVAVVNGPAIGLALTLLGLFDAVYASDKGMKISKELMRKNEKQKLQAVNAEESTIIQERLTSEECSNALLKFVSRKVKL